MCLWEFLRVTIGTCVFCADGIMITNNSNNNYVFLNVFMFRIMSMTLRTINPQKEMFHHYDFPVYTTSKYRDPKLNTYRRITHFYGECDILRIVWEYTTQAMKIYNVLLCDLDIFMAGVVHSNTSRNKAVQYYYTVHYIHVSMKLTFYS